jgi:hypothetical protein
MLELAKTTADVLSKNFPNYTYSLNENKLVILKNNNEKNIPEKESFFNLGLF